MADERVLLIEGHADSACPNCNTTQLNKFKLYWNETTTALEVDKVCVCQIDGDDGTAYKEEDEVGLTAK